MKICFIIHNVTARAGSERAQANLANALSVRGESISIWSMYGAGKSSGFPLSGGVRVSYGRKTPLPCFLDYPWLACIFAVHVIRERPDWIVCTGANRLIVALIAAVVPGVKIVIWEHFPVTNSVTRPRGRVARRIASVVASRIVTLTKMTRICTQRFMPREKGLPIFPTSCNRRARAEEFAARKFSPWEGFLGKRDSICCSKHGRLLCRRCRSGRCALSAMDRCATN